MGHIIHHAITCTTYDKVKAIDLFNFCKGIGASVSFVNSNINDYLTVFIDTDGSKSGWSDSEMVDARRISIKDKIRSFAYSDNSNPFEWVEVSYSHDDKEAKIVESGAESNPQYQRLDQPLATDNHLQKLMTAAKDWRDAGDNCFLEERNLIKIIDEICLPNLSDQGAGKPGSAALRR